MMGSPARLSQTMPRGGVDRVGDAALSRLIGYNLKRTFNGIHVDLSDVLRPLGLRMITFTILTMLKENPGVRLSNLALAIDMEKPNIVSLIDELAAQQLVTRSADPDDRRARQLHLTAAGTELQRQAYGRVCEHEAAFLRDLSDSERQQLVSILAKIRRSAGQRAFTA
ncbi:MarR family winged helix-turn-helix transcriptional regulator [Alphaproteobacteria bacterium LSUCC0719]